MIAAAADAEDAGAEDAGASARRNAWMITFVDLISLMLTFMVMLYAMSDLPTASPPRPRVDDLAATIDWRERELPARAARHGAESVGLAPAKDLDYLQGILEAALAEEPSRPPVSRREDRLIVDLPLPAAAPASPAADPSGRGGRRRSPDDPEARVLRTLARLLNGVDNRVEIHAVMVAVAPDRNPGTAAAPLATAWEACMTRALAAAGVMAAAGLERPVPSYGLAEPLADRLGVEKEDRRQPPAPRIRVVVLAGAGE